MKINRKRNAVNGTFFGIILRFTHILFSFVIRTVFIWTLGLEYLGLNSLFSAVIQVLNLAELGVGSALVFSMYRPIAEDDDEKICQLLNLYKFYYRIIGWVVLIIGVVLVPFLPYLIKGSVPPEINIYVIYAFHLATTVFSYWFWAYRNSLFEAHQRKDIISIISIITYLILYGLQIIVLIFLRNYYIYLCLSVIAQVVINLLTALFAKKIYPDYYPKGFPPKQERVEINRKVRDLFAVKIGSVVNNSADSVVISAFLGLELLAKYQNYYYIVFSIMAMINIFLNACTAGIGNSLVLDSAEQNKKLLYNINHISFMTINICTSCFVCLCQPFMKLWVGEKNELGFQFVILFALYLVAEGCPRTLISFKNAGGIWREDRFRPLISAGINLALNLLLTPFIGLYGIIISTILALMLVSFPWLIINVNNRLLEIDIRKYMKKFFLYFITIVFSSATSYVVSSVCNMESSIVNLILKLFVSVVVSLIIFLTIHYRTDENRYLINQLYLLRKKNTE